MSGYVVERNALPNMYAQPDTKLYAITTLSNIGFTPWSSRISWAR